MKVDDVMNRDDFRRCESFHGHVCPGLALGYVAASVAMERLQERSAEDEELVAVVENDACFADAVQVLTGCTFGKGNFFFKDHGKLALSLMSRTSGRGVRVCLKPGSLDLDEEHARLLAKVLNGDAADHERRRFEELHTEKTRRILASPWDTLFQVKEVHQEIPRKARIQPSIECSLCGEPTMEGRMAVVEGMRVCRACAEKGSDESQGCKG